MRREAAELCRISSPQARNLLQRLAQKDLLGLHGQRRGAFYAPLSKTMDLSKTEMDAPKESKSPSKKIAPP